MSKQTSANHILSNNKSPIGLFDSGVGGLSVYQHLQDLLPDEEYLYFADILNMPYGAKSPDQIIDLTLNAVNWLHRQGCKLIVIACNSASAHALQIARQRHPNTPIVGLVPALKPAVFATKSNHVAVLATQATLDGELLNTVIKKFAQPKGVKVSKHFNPHLVPWVESGMPKYDNTAQDLSDLVKQFHDHGVDQIVLGCTHYPFFRPYLKKIIEKNGWNIQIIDSGAAIAERVSQLLTEEDLLAQDSSSMTTELSSTLNMYSSLIDDTLPIMLDKLITNHINIIAL